MKHIYKSGKDLFGEYYVSFTIQYNGQKYGYYQTFMSLSDKTRMLRSLAYTKQKLIESIQIINKANKYKIKLNKFKV